MSEPAPPGAGAAPSPEPWSAESYRRFLEEAWPRYQRRMTPQERVRLTTEYLMRLPVHVIARCPHCGRELRQHVDTLSLNGFGWENPGVGYGWAHSLGGQLPLADQCPHARIIAEYLNLKGERPDDLFADKVIRSGPEVPGIMAAVMTAPGARAVLHELPIARFGDPALRPRYAVYFVCYFTETAAEFEAATAAWGGEYGRVDDLDLSHDLEQWVRKGRLRWLDRGHPELPLADPDAAAFPYRDIPGDRWPWHIITRDGSARPRRSLADRLLDLFGRRRPYPPVS